MDVGTGIVIGCTILGGVAVGFRIFPSKKNSNPNSKYLLTERFEEYKEGILTQLNMLTTSVTKLETGVKRVHSRIDEILKK